MNSLLQIALINAVTVLPLAILAFAISRIARRPALTHAVWVLVLLKLVTPPLFNLPFTIDVPVAETRNVPISERMAPKIASQEAAASKAMTTTSDATRRIDPQVSVNDSANRRIENQRQSASLITRGWLMMSAVWARPPNLQTTILACWIAGTTFWAVLQLACLIRFRRRVVRDAIAPPELQAETEQLAMKLGLRRVPQVLVVDATISPMLWGCGTRPSLLFPAELAERLDDSARATLLTHELAHFGRGDQWVRLLELIATGLFWWHPVVWWARGQIEESEEECCDAWVIAEFPATPRQYAEALLDTVDFLCETRFVLPPVASGFGQAQFLRRRLTKIMRGPSPKALSHRGRCAVLLATALLLPLQPFVFGSSSITSLRIDPVPQYKAEIQSTKEQDLPSESAAEPSDISPSPEVQAAPAPATTSSRLRGEKTWSASVSPDGRYVIRTTTARRVLLVDLRTDVETDLSDERISAIAFAPNGKWFAAAGQDGRLTIWDSASGKLQKKLATHTDALRSVAVAPNGQSIAVGGRDGNLMVLDLETGEPLFNFEQFSTAVNCVRFSPDGMQLAVAVGDWISNRSGKVMLLDAVTGQVNTELPCPSSPGALAFASNDELIVGHWDGYTELWNLVRQKVIGSAKANKNIVAAAAFSPDNPVMHEVTFVATESGPRR